MKTDIFYFSGTGNSLMLAKMISQATPESRLVNIANRESESTGDNDKNCVVVFPTYGFSAPGVVKNFLKNLDAAQYGYFCMVATKAGSPEFCYPDLSEILRKQNRKIDAFFSVQMPNNSFLIHDFNKPEDAAEKIANAKRFTVEASALIARRKSYIPKQEKMSLRLAVMFRCINAVASLTNYMNFDKAFSSTAACVSCGICAGVCPSHKIVMNSGKPSWNNRTKCHCCTACINYCPQRAIVNKVLKPSKINPSNQYTNPEVSVSEIMRNNS